MSTTLPRPAPPSSRVLIVLAFLAIYVIWGSTYLAIRYAIETIPPLLTAGFRHLVAGSILLAWGLAHGKRPTFAQWRASLVLGFLFFLLGHGSLHWAEQTVPSGIAALLIATEPIFLAVLIALTAKRMPDRSTIAGLILGLIGVALLIKPDPAHPHGSLIGAIVVLLGSLAWSTGVFLSRRSQLAGDPLMMTTLSLLSGAAMLLLVALLAGEARGFHPADVSLRSLLGMVFLIVFGSLIAFTALNWLLERCSPTLVITHSYVNPVVALLLGWAVGGERLDLSVLAATALVVAAVVLVSRAES